MYLFQSSSLLILTFFITLPASFSAPTTDLTEDDVQGECDTFYPVPGHPTWSYNAPFPSHCRSLANQMALFPDAQTLLPFDKRYPTSGPGQFIPAPYSRGYGTCVVAFYPPATPGAANPNLARYADFAKTVRFSTQCFDVLPGKESKDDVVALAKYNGKDGNAWTMVLTGPVGPPRSTGGNATMLDGNSRSSFNVSLTEVGGEEDGTSATARVDVT